MTTRITTENITDATIATADIASSVPLNTQWQSVFTGDGSTGLTAVAGRGYFIDTTSGTVTVTLPNDSSSSVGDTIIIRDYAGTFATNNVTITSTAKISEADADGTLSTNDLVMTLTYVNSTKGWVTMENEAKAVGAQDILYITATGGTITTSGDFKIHSFTGDGCFVVSCGGNPAGSTSVDYLVVAGGGGGGASEGAPFRGAGGGGGGGFRESKSGCTGCWTASPLVATTAIPVSVQTYPITVGAGGAGAIVPPGNDPGTQGSSSIFSTITSAGGGGGASSGGACGPGGSGGSGGGGTRCGIGGAGNTPPVSPPQGFPGGHQLGVPDSDVGRGGGGAGGAGPPSSLTGAPGATTCITGSPNTYAAGGSANQGSVTSGPANSGDAGDGGTGTPAPGAAGGSGIVIIRYKFQ